MECIKVHMIGEGAIIGGWATQAKTHGVGGRWS